LAHSPYVTRIIGVSIDNRGGGVVICRWRSENKPAVECWDYLTTVLAGLAAETLFFPQTDYLGGALDLFAAEKIAQELVVVDWLKKEWLTVKPLISDKHQHPDFIPLEQRLESPAGTASIMQLAYQRAFFFLFRQRQALLKLAHHLDQRRLIYGLQLIIILGPRVARIRSLAGLSSRLDDTLSIGG